MRTLIKDLMVFLMWYPLRMAINILPLRVVYGIGIAGGLLLYLLSGDKQKIMAEELTNIMPERNAVKPGKLIRGSFINYCVSELEVLLYPSLNRHFIKEHVTVEGREHLEAALSKGKGVLLFQAHFGAFQMTMPAIGYSGYKMNQISASASLWNDDASISRVRKKAFLLKAGYEYALPVKHIPVRSSLRPVFNALAENEIVGVTADGGGGKKTVEIQFLGRTANFQQGPADLAIRTGAEIVPAFIITESGLRHRLVLHPPIKIRGASNREDQLQTVLQEFGNLLECYVLRYPSHYLYTLFLRRSRAGKDAYPFFTDYTAAQFNISKRQMKGADYA